MSETKKKEAIKDKSRAMVISKGTAPNGQPTVTIYESEYNELKILSGNSSIDYQAINEAFDSIQSQTSLMQSTVFNIKRSLLLAIQGYTVSPQGGIIPLNPPGEITTEEESKKEGEDESVNNKTQSETISHL